MLVRFDGRLTEVNPVQASNSPVFRLVILGGIVIEDSPRHFSKA